LMVAIMFMAILMDRRALSMRNVAIAGFAILLFTPESILSASFQMSFLAVIGIIALHENLPPQQADAGIWARGFRMFWIAGAVSLVAGIYSGIPAAYHFHRLSPYSLPANMLAAPVVGFLVMPMALASALFMPLGLEAWALWALGIGLDGVLAIAGLITQLPGAAKRIAEPSVMGVLLIALAALWFGLWQGRVRYYAGLFLIIGLGLSGVKDQPDILIERTARNVAVRLEDGRLAFAHSRRGRFAAERWLAAEADNAKLSEAAKRGWQCAEGVCEIWAKGRRILFVQELSQFKCLAGDIIIADYPLRGACRDAALRIDRIDVWRNGAEAVFIRPDRLIVKTAQGERGRRPWVTQVKPRLKPAAAQSSSITAQ
jgi:competence protein ComEC